MSLFNSFNNSSKLSSFDILLVRFLPFCFTSFSKDLQPSDNPSNNCSLPEHAFNILCIPSLKLFNTFLDLPLAILLILSPINTSVVTARPVDNVGLDFSPDSIPASTNPE